MPPADSANVGHDHSCHSTSTPPARISSSSPQERNSSIDRVLTEVARGRLDISARRSTSRLSMPSRARAPAAVRPAGPAPTIRTSVLSVVGSIMSLSVGPSSFDRTVCLIQDSLSSEMLRCLAMAPRKYDEKLRAEAAEETRRRILDAVLERFSEAPTEGVSVDQVARMAGVARSTVYLVFGSRAGLFDAVARDLLERGGFDRVVRATEDPDARRH